MKNIAYYSGKIEFNKEGCFVGKQKVDCPTPLASRATRTGDKLDILPRIPSFEIRSDTLFFTLLLVIILGFGALAVFKVKIFGKTLGEYIKPIWYFILISLVMVAWQYLFGLKLNDNFMSIRISQLIWEICIAVSAYKLIKFSNFNYGNLFFLGILYSMIVHGFKITIRYLFYGKTFLYLVDRFLYGSLLVMAIAFLGGSMLLYFRKKEIIKF
ncbi:MAG: hypothetical protein AAB954_00435 [Patescibacteria group bacterium]